MHDGGASANCGALRFGYEKRGARQGDGWAVHLARGDGAPALAVAGAESRSVTRRRTPPYVAAGRGPGTPRWARARRASLTLDTRLLTLATTLTLLVFLT